MGVDSIKEASRCRHRGIHLSLWVSDEQAAKLDALAQSSGKSRTDVIKKLIDGRSIKDKSFWKTYSKLASIGGLIMSHVRAGEHGKAYNLGREILHIARRLEATVIEQGDLK